MPLRSHGRLDWNKLRVFHAVAEAGSFTHASESLYLSQSAVSRQIGSLEESLGVRLFYRHARGLIPTEQGDLLYRTVDDVFSKLNSVEGLLTETKKKPGGTLRVTTTVAFGSVWLTSRLKDFALAYPSVEVTLRLDDRELDLAMREADIAIRFNEPKQQGLIQRHIGSMASNIYASPEYLAARGTPESLEDLATHDVILFGEGATPVSTVHWFTELLDSRAIESHVALRVNNLYGIYRAVKAGLGIASLPEYFVEEGNGITKILREVNGPDIEGYFVYPQELRNSTRVSIFLNFLLREAARSKKQRTKWTA